jgi:Siphovirus ReqiPepy6 Gp37-like protein
VAAILMAILNVNGWSRSFAQASGGLAPPARFPLPSAGSEEYVDVQMLDNNLNVLGPIQYVTINATLYLNAVGSWSMLVPYSDALWAQMMAGEFMVDVNWRGLFHFGGKCEQPAYMDSIPGSTGGGQFPGPFIQLSGGDYLALIANRIAYPNPTAAWTAQAAGSTDAVSAMALESAIKHYVSRNLGSAALASRRHSLVDIATDLARGAATSYTVKFGSGVDINLLDVVRALIAQTNTSLGISLVRNGSRLTFDVYVPRNLTNIAWFSEDLGNLTAIDLYLTDPTCTDALVQGASAFIARTATARTQWNLTEQFIDDSAETDANNLATTAQTALLTGAAGPLLNATTADIPYLTYGRDYRLGDIVTVEVKTGAFYTDVITAVTLVADPTQNPAISVVPTLGNSANATATDQTITGQLITRVKALEQKLATK